MQAVWYSPDEPDTLVEPQQVALRSIHSKQATVITFTNTSKHRVRALWVDFNGNEVSKHTVSSTRTQLTSSSISMLCAASTSWALECLDVLQALHDVRAAAE